MANVMRGNRQCTKETLNADFMDFSQEFIDAKGDLEFSHNLEMPDLEEGLRVIEALTKEVIKKEQKVDSVLDLALDLGLVAIKEAQSA